MNYETITEQTGIIINNLNLLDINISKIKLKIASINKMYQTLEKNKILVVDDTNSFLIFQMEILRNEYSYYKKLYYLVLNKYTNEIYDLSDYVLMILLSLNKLEIGESSKKASIINNIIHVTKIKKISYGKLNEIINSTINNLKLIDTFIQLFDKYISKTFKKNTKNNIHNNNYELSIRNKKETILLEYNKYCSRFINIIKYFKTCSDSIINQIDTSKLIDFFLTEKSI
jgi:hypothetical protein